MVSELVGKIVDMWSNGVDVEVECDGIRGAVDVREASYVTKGRIGVTWWKLLKEPSLSLSLPVPGARANALALELEYGATLMDILTVFLSPVEDVENWLISVVSLLKELYSDASIASISWGLPNSSERSIWMDRRELELPPVEKPLVLYVKDAVRSIIDVWQKGKFAEYAFDSYFRYILNVREVKPSQEVNADISIKDFKTEVKMVLPRSDEVGALYRIVSLGFLDGEYKGGVDFVNKLIRAGFDQPLVRVLGSALETLGGLYSRAGFSRVNFRMSYSRFEFTSHSSFEFTFS